MAVTFNRRPSGVNTPSSKNVEYNYFSHFNWKGINENKNFLTVDQETFSDCKNIYIDDVGLLCSRPSVKVERTNMQKYIKDLKVFGDIIICTYKDGESDNLDLYLAVIENGQFVAQVKINDYPSLRSFRDGDNIYAFTVDKIFVYNVDTRVLNDATMYVPVTRVYETGSYSTYDSENLFASYSKYRYLLYPSTAGDFVSNGINSNAFGKIGEYTVYVNEKPVSRKVTLDKNGKFLNTINQPLLYDTDDTYTINAYGVDVPTMFIYNDFIYKLILSRGVLQRASIATGIFETIVDLSNYNFNEFVKIKPSDNYVLIILTYSVIIFNINSFEISVRNDVTNFIYRKYLDYTIAFDSKLNKTKELAATVGTYPDQNGDPIQPFHIYLDNVNYAYPDDVSVMDCSYKHNEAHDRVLAFKDIMARTDLKYLKTRLDDFSVSSNEQFYTLFIGNVQLDSRLIFSDVITIPSENQVTNTDTFSMLGTTTSRNDYYRPRPTVPQYVPKANINKTSDGRLAGAFVYGDAINFGTLVPAHYSTQINDGKFVALRPKFSEEATNSNYTNKSFFNGTLFFVPTHVSSTKVYEFENLDIVIDTPGKFLSSDLGDYWLYVAVDDGVVFSNYRASTQNIDILVDKINEYKYPETLLHCEEIYASSNNEVYIGNIVKDVDDVDKLYFKKLDKHTLDDRIRAFHKISDNEIAIFTAEGTWYTTQSNGLRYYKKSKIVPVIKEGSDMVTLQDSTTALMPSDAGIITLSYQNFVNTTEQSTTNIAQDITSIYRKFEGSIFIVNYKWYTIFYDERNILLFDNRNASWWPWQIPWRISKIFEFDGELYILSDSDFFKFVNDPDKYYDEAKVTTEYTTSAGNKGFRYSIEPTHVDWNLVSQKLHLSTNNHYKHITNLTLASVETSNRRLSLKLNVKNYRDFVNNKDAEVFDYYIDVIRTFIKRLNYAKVCEFQYTLSSDNSIDPRISTSLALSNITIKYKIGGQVR